MKLRSHAGYKATDAQWLASIPAHWELVPSNWLFHESAERARPDDPHLSATQKYGVIPLQEFERLEGRRVTHAFKNLDQRKHTELNDFVISMRSFEGGIERVMAQGCVRSSYIVLHTTAATHVGYFSYLFKSTAYIQGLQATATFIRDGQDLNFNNFRQIKLPRLGVEEQSRIAAFLDRETARIDALIEKKTRFIELLREKRQALITHAVTKGLDPGAPMKDSGVEWLGQVPAHWAVCKLNFRYTVELGKMLDGKKVTGIHPVAYLRNQDVQWQGINAHDLPVMDIAPEEMERYTAVAGDLLVCEGGEVGRAAIWHGEPIGYQKALHRLRPRRRDDVGFMYLLLQAAKGAGAFDEGDTKSTISHLPAEKFRDFKFVFPPAGEQSEIVGIVRVKTTRIDTLIAKTERSVELLREKRTALITAAVTGKIDLREAA